MSDIFVYQKICVGYNLYSKLKSSQMCLLKSLKMSKKKKKKCAISSNFINNFDKLILKLINHIFRIFVNCQLTKKFMCSDQNDTNTVFTVHSPEIFFSS